MPPVQLLLFLVAIAVAAWVVVRFIVEQPEHGGSHDAHDEAHGDTAAHAS